MASSRLGAAINDMGQEGVAVVVAAHQVEIAGLKRSVDDLSTSVKELNKNLTGVLEYINIQKGQKQMAALIGGSIGLLSGGLGTTLVWIVTQVGKHA